jgi:hypothetical protein
MQTLNRLFLAMILAHLLSDFVFQTDKIVKGKGKGQFLSYIQHGISYYLCNVAIVSFLIPGYFFMLRLHYVSLVLTGIHLLIDWLKSVLITNRSSGDTFSFIADQILHVITIFISAAIIVRTALSELYAKVSCLRSFDNKILSLLVVYISVIFAGGYLIRFLTKSLSRDAGVDESSAQLRNAGLYIGWLERFLVMTAFLLQSPAAAGLILAAKSIARYPEMKSARFAEYFLIGTLLSICLAIVGAAVLLKLL